MSAIIILIFFTIFKLSGVGANILGLQVLDFNFREIEEDRDYEVIDGQQRIATLLGLCGELRRAIGTALEDLTEVERAVLERVVERQTYELEMSLSFKVAEPDDSILPRMIRGGEDRWWRGGGEGVWW